MKRFTQLFQDIDATTSTNAKVQRLQAYFEDESAANAIWAIYLFLGKTRRRLITSRRLRDIFLHISDLPEWLFEDCYAHVGDTSEAIALLLKATPLPPQDLVNRPLHEWMETIIPSVKVTQSDAEIRELVIAWWSSLEPFEVFVLNKLLTGAFRVGVSDKLVVRALSAASGIAEPVLTHRLMGDVEPTGAFYMQLVSPDQAERPPSQPYPFFLAAPLDDAKFEQELDWSRWQAEWKWDGIRAQIIKRADQVFIWSRGEDLITHQFPELEDVFQPITNGTVLDGEILCWQGDRPMKFNALQKRLGRKRVSQALMNENPVCFMAYDLLEHNGQDIRAQPLGDRRTQLESTIQTYASSQLSLTESLVVTSFRDLQTLREHSRERGAEGLMIKAKDSPYLVGRKRGFWWKYKVEPMTLDAVLIYAQAGTGKRANLFTDYTFALWHNSELIPFAKAYSGLDNAEINELDKWIRRHTIEKFGPVRSVTPTHVFEIGFEGISASNRHKSGIAVRFPRILRWRKDKPITEADTLQSALDLLSAST